jgi:hypothetical protein
MNVESRLIKLEQTANNGLNVIDHIDICFKNGEQLTGVRRIWVNCDKPDEEFTPEQYKERELGLGPAATLAAARKRAQESLLKKEA